MLYITSYRRCAAGPRAPRVVIILYIYNFIILYYIYIILLSCTDAAQQGLALLAVVDAEQVRQHADLRTHARTQTHTHTHTPTRTHVQMHKDARTRTRTCTHAHTRARTH